MWKWIGNNEKQIKIVFSIIAAVYIFVEYQEKITQDRIANSMGYVLRYTSEPFLEVTGRLDSFWLSDQLTELNMKLLKEPDSSARFKKYNETIPELLHATGRDRDVYRILQFYRDVGLCINAKRCDSKTACDFFFKDMLSFRSNYRPLMEEWSQTLGETAPGELSDIIDQTCSENFIQYCKNHPTSNYCK